MKLVLGWVEKRALRELRERAWDDVVDAAAAVELCKTPEGLAQHRARMVKLTVLLPRRFSVTYSLEHQPRCLCRHMTVSVFDQGRTVVPRQSHLDALAGEMGFRDLSTCRLWIEDLPCGGNAVAVLQPVQVIEQAAA